MKYSGAKEISFLQENQLSILVSDAVIQLNALSFSVPSVCLGQIRGQVGSLEMNVLGRLAEIYTFPFEPS